MKTQGGHEVTNFKQLETPISNGILEPHIYMGDLINDKTKQLQTTTWDRFGRCRNWQVPQYFLDTDLLKRFNESIDGIVIEKGFEFGTVAYLKRVATNIQNETKPIKGHPDPGAITDCWNQIRDCADKLFDEAEVKRMLFRVAELAAMDKERNPHNITALHINYDQVIANKGKVVDMPKDH